MAQALPAPTARIRFRPYRRADAEAVAEMFDDPQARRFYPDMTDPGRAAQWIQWNMDNYANHGFGLWVTEHVVTGAFLGDCGLTYQPVEGEQLLEVGYHLHAQYRGQGYATEAGRASIAHSFGELDAPLVCSIVDPDNTQSLAVAARLHACEGTFTNANGREMRLYWSTPD